MQGLSQSPAREFINHSRPGGTLSSVDTPLLRVVGSTKAIRDTGAIALPRETVSGRRPPQGVDRNSRDHRVRIGAPRTLRRRHYSGQSARTHSARSRAAPTSGPAPRSWTPERLGP